MAVVILVAGAGVTPALAQLPSDSAPPALRAARAANGDIVLDGVLDEPAWLTADSLTDFHQQEPAEGAGSSERTVVRALAARGGLYIGVWAYDARPGGIVHAQLRRDGQLSGDDFVSVLIDAQLDHRSALVFTTNANGVVVDAQLANGETDTDWNGVWDVRSRVSPQGWTAEFFIPWQVLRSPAGARTVGFNVERFLRAKNERVFWRAWLRQQGLGFQVVEGLLELPDPLPRRELFEGRPYVAGSQEADTRVFDPVTGAESVVTRGGPAVQAGFDGKLAVAPQVTMDVTVNTDFAQVEADRQVVNLSRFPVFFPEKRQFFLESAGIFALGQSERTQLFNSRRIGLDSSGQVVPIAAGARITGRVGAERIGLLAVRTGGHENAFDAVARIQHDVLERGYVGGMVTYQGGPGLPDQHIAAGADFALPLLIKGQNFIPQGFVAFTRNDAGQPAATAWRLFFDYPNDWADNFLAISRIEPGFDPTLGFVRQRGVQRQTGQLHFYPRPHRWGIRRLSIKPIEFDINEHLDGSLDHASYEVIPIGGEFENGSAFEFNITHQDDVPADSFEIFPGTAIAPGRYGWNRAELQLESSPARPVLVRTAIGAGTFYNGRATEWQYEFGARIEPRFLLGMDGGWQWVRLAGSSFLAQVHRIRIDYATNPRMNSTLFVQWDNESNRLAVNARIHWTPVPGTDAYLVWNTAWAGDVVGHTGFNWSRPLRGALIGKVVSYFRL